MKSIILSIEEQDYLFSYLTYLDKNTWYHITDKEIQDYIDGEPEDKYNWRDGWEETLDVLKKLKGFKIKYKQKGTHYSDGTEVMYEFIFKSPNKIKTKFSTLMCLMIGWDMYSKLEIK